MTSNIFANFKGNFLIGCNYWASHAGTQMWEAWNGEVVDRDLHVLSQHGIQALRVFPLWPFFQPIDTLYGGGGYKEEYRFGETQLPYGEAGKSGVNETAMHRFDIFCEIADKYNIKLIVGLITGWMSGRLFVPPALRGKNILTDSECIMWQIKFVKYFVKSNLNKECIIAWDLGNECNGMQANVSREQAWVWTSHISNAIKSIDNKRPVISGMHSLSPKGAWRIEDQAENTDILTTHPYPLWTPYCDQDPINTMKPLMHSTAETRYYQDIGEKLCFAEEIGTMGPMICSNDVEASFARTVLFSLWANGCNGFMWWCANDQEKLEHAPYSWMNCERELGLLNSNGEAKPVLSQIKKFADMLKSIPLNNLPLPEREAVCIINTDQNHWAVALSSYILSKQAGFNIEFQFEDQPLKDALLYLIPSIKGNKGIPKRKWEEVFQRVFDGADVYISFENTFISEFNKFTGINIRTRYHRTQKHINMVLCANNSIQIPVVSDLKYEFINEKAEILACEEDGSIAYACYKYGKGKVYVLPFALEEFYSKNPGIITNSLLYKHYEIYNIFSERIKSKRLLKKSNPFIGVTEHRISSSRAIISAINYSPEEQEFAFYLQTGWQIENMLYGQMPTKNNLQHIGRINPNDAILFFITNKDA